VSWFDRNASSGSLSFGGTFKSSETNGARYLVLSNDDAHVYVTGYADDSVSWFDRNSTTGALTLIGTLRDGINGVDGLDGSLGICFSPNEKHLYIASFNDDSISWFDRNSSSAELTYGGTLKNGVNGVTGLDGPQYVTLSADGKFAYVSAEDDNSITWFKRNLTTGDLS
jgi:6-phosphogluconolactonase (cycloisomerase 2 family)